MSVPSLRFCSFAVLQLCAYHDLRVTQNILVASRVQYDAARVGVHAVDVQHTQPPLLLSPLQDLNTHTHFTVHHTQSCSNWQAGKIPSAVEGTLVLI